MPNHSAIAIANEFLRRRGLSSWPQQMQIQKLAYIAHGWSLAIHGQSLIDEAPQAWDNGPVFRSVWDRIKDFGYRGKNCTLINPFDQREETARLSAAEVALIDHVWAKYGHRTAHELSGMTHEIGTPWHEAYFNRGRNTPLENRAIQNHYTQLAIAGRG